MNHQIPTPTAQEATMLTPTDFIANAQAAGFRVSARNTQEERFGGNSPQSWVVEITRTFEAGDAAAYSQAEVEAFRVLSGIPRPYPGTTWGTTSDGVGGHAGLTSGEMRLLVSGVGVRFAKGVAKA